MVCGWHQMEGDRKDGWHVARRKCDVGAPAGTRGSEMQTSEAS
jgi:hypothetical protein